MQQQQLEEEEEEEEEESSINSWTDLVEASIITRSVAKQMRRDYVNGENCGNAIIIEQQRRQKERISQKAKRKKDRAIKKSANVSSDTRAETPLFFPGKGFLLLNTVTRTFAKEGISLHVDAREGQVQITTANGDLCQEVRKAMGACLVWLSISGIVKPYNMQFLSSQNIRTFVHDLAFVYNLLEAGQILNEWAYYYIGDGLYFCLIPNNNKSPPRQRDMKVLGVFLRATESCPYNLHNAVALRVGDFMWLYKRLITLSRDFPTFYFFEGMQDLIPCHKKHKPFDGKASRADCNQCSIKVNSLNCFGKRVAHT